MKPSAPPRRIAVLAYPGAQILDVTGPLEVFSRAERWLRDHGKAAEPAYEVEILGLTRGPFACSSGLQLVASRGFEEVDRGLDTLLVSGGAGLANALAHPGLAPWLRLQAGRVRRLGSVCTGTFLLAQAGLLEGRRATTHWDYFDRFEREHPAVALDRNALYVKDGTLYSSGGVTAGMDLALALLEEDLGRDLSLQVARQLVLFLHRPGGQSQFSAQLGSQLAQRRPLRELQAWIAEHPQGNLSVPALSRRLAMSVRNFSRVFEAEVGVSPGRYVEKVRVETARRLLEESQDSVEQVAAAAGFGSSEALRRTFHRAMGVAPVDYRSRFRH